MKWLRTYLQLLFKPADRQIAINGKVVWVNEFFALILLDHFNGDMTIPDPCDCGCHIGFTGYSKCCPCTGMKWNEDIDRIKRNNAIFMPIIKVLPYKLGMRLATWVESWNN